MINRVGVSKTSSTSDTTKVNKSNGKNIEIPMIDTNGLKPEQREAAQNLIRLINDGKVKYHTTNFFEDILNISFDKKYGDYITIRDFSDKENLSIYEAKVLLGLNLPEGSLKHNIGTRGGGDFDSYAVPKAGGKYYLDIYLDDLVEATGLTKKQIKTLCNQEK